MSVDPSEWSLEWAIDDARMEVVRLMNEHRHLHRKRHEIDDRMQTVQDQMETAALRLRALEVKRSKADMLGHLAKLRNGKHE